MKFRPGLHRHWKGNMYLAVALAEDSNNGPDGTSTQEPTVIYISLDAGPKQGQLDTRWLRQWEEMVPNHSGELVPRFQYVGPD